jgi:glycosyltransferase involved in cell wall biosynthesis
MFGYPQSSARAVTTAVARLRASHAKTELWLLGAPGADSPVGRRWRLAAYAAGVQDVLRFSGILDAIVLADQIRSCDLCVFDDVGGPSARKTTLAAMLALGRPVVAIDGPNTWSTLKDEHAVRLVANGAALGDALIELTHDARARERLGRQAFAFYHRHQARAIVSATIGQFVDLCLGSTMRS